MPCLGKRPKRAAVIGKNVRSRVRPVPGRFFLFCFTTQIYLLLPRRGLSSRLPLHEGRGQLAVSHSWAQSTLARSFDNASSFRGEIFVGTGPSTGFFHSLKEAPDPFLMLAHLTPPLLTLETFLLFSKQEVQRKSAFPAHQNRWSKRRAWLLLKTGFLTHPGKRGCFAETRFVEGRLPAEEITSLRNAGLNLCSLTPSLECTTFLRTG